MNPHNPTMHDVRRTAEIFFQQMKRITLQQDPRLAWQQSFDLQCSDRWC